MNHFPFKNTTKYKNLETKMTLVTKGIRTIGTCQRVGQKFKRGECFAT